MGDKYDNLTTEDLIVALRQAPEIQRNNDLNPIVLQRLAADQLHRWINGATGEQIRQLQHDLEEAQKGHSPAEPEYSAETWQQRAQRFERLSNEYLSRALRVETELEVANRNLEAARQGRTSYCGTSQTWREHVEAQVGELRRLQGELLDQAQRADNAGANLTALRSELEAALSRAHERASELNAARSDEHFVEVTDDLRLIGFGPAARDQLEQAIHRVATCGHGDPTVTVYGTNPEASALTGRLFGMNEGGVSLVIDMGHPEAECAHVTIPVEAVRLIVIH